MKVYEMIFHKGYCEHVSSFYTVNNIDTRLHFIDHIRSEILSEFYSSKLNTNKDLLLLAEEIYKEDLIHMDIISNEFIKKSQGVFNEFIYIEIKEHRILSI